MGTAKQDCENVEKLEEQLSDVDHDNLCYKFMHVTRQDIKTIEIAYDHFLTDLEGGAVCDEFENETNKLKQLLSKMRKAFKHQVTTKDM